jgi:hypothetical protein
MFNTLMMNESETPDLPAYAASPGDHCNIGNPELTSDPLGICTKPELGCNDEKPPGKGRQSSRQHLYAPPQHQTGGQIYRAAPSFLC